jgi:hypothetical protein
MLRFLAVPAALILLASCQEKGPKVDFFPPPVDTAYAAPVEAQQARTVLIEEFTGVTCPQCPAGHQTLKALYQADTSRIAIIGIQPIGNAQSRPYDKDGVKTRFDNRTQAGTDVGSTIYGGILSLPQAGIDRISNNGSISGLFGRGDWGAKFAERKGVAAKANITIKALYDPSDRRAAITVRVAYTSDVTYAQRLTVAMTENEVVDVQETATSHIDDYDHEHVLRDILTNPAGSAILSGQSFIPAGQVYERTFIYSVPDGKGWNPEHCRIVAYVCNNGTDNQEVIQAAEQPLVVLP